MKLVPTYTEMGENPNMLDAAKNDCIASYDAASTEVKEMIIRGIVETYYQFQYKRSSYRNIDGGKRVDWIELATASSVAEHAGVDVSAEVAKLRAESIDQEIERAKYFSNPDLVSVPGMWCYTDTKRRYEQAVEELPELLKEKEELQKSEVGK